MPLSIKYSVVIPVHNEEESIGPLCGSLKRVLDGLSECYEVIIINDGSVDQTMEAIQRIQAHWSNLVVINFERCRGKSPALQAGLNCAKGKIIITMDGDLQNDPEDIPKLLKKMAEGYDVVCGWRRLRYDPWNKKMISCIANFIRRAAYKESIHDVGCALRAYTFDAIKYIDLSGQRHRFLTAILKKKGARIAEVEVIHHARLFGKSKYGVIGRIIDSTPDFFTLLINSNNDKKRSHQ